MIKPLDFSEYKKNIRQEEIEIAIQRRIKEKYPQIMKWERYRLARLVYLFFYQENDDGLSK